VPHLEIDDSFCGSDKRIPNIFVYICRLRQRSVLIVYRRVLIDANVATANVMACKTTYTTMRTVMENPAKTREKRIFVGWFAHCIECFAHFAASQTIECGGWEITNSMPLGATVVVQIHPSAKTNKHAAQACFAHASSAEHTQRKSKGRRGISCSGRPLPPPAQQPSAAPEGPRSLMLTSPLRKIGVGSALL
jgi:hypothetical protein